MRKKQPTLPLFNGRTREVYSKRPSVKKDVRWALEAWREPRVAGWRLVYALDFWTRGGLFRGRLRGGQRWPR